MLFFQTILFHLNMNVHIMSVIIIISCNNGSKSQRGVRQNDMV